MPAVVYRDQTAKRGAYHEYDCAMAGLCPVCERPTYLETAPDSQCDCRLCPSCLRIWVYDPDGYNEGRMAQKTCPECLCARCEAELGPDDDRPVCTPCKRADERQRAYDAYQCQEAERDR